jgi:hypothetical protein
MATQFLRLICCWKHKSSANSPKSPTTTQTFSDALSRTYEWQSAC